MTTLTAESTTTESTTPRTDPNPAPPSMDTCPLCGSHDITSTRGDDGILYSTCNACAAQWTN